MTHCQRTDHVHPEHAGRKEIDVPAVVADGIRRIREIGMRRTRLLEDVLMLLASNPRPLTIAEIGSSLSGACDMATLYRMVDRLVAAGLLRRIGMQDRALYHDLKIPGLHRDYLICTDCGAIGDIEASCPVKSLERDLAKRTGYENLRHDLVFYGRCPECAKEP